MVKMLVRQFVYLGVLLCTSVSLAKGHPADDDFDDIWRTTHINMSLISYYTQEVIPCRASAENFLACVELINGLGDQLEPKQMLLPRNHGKDYPELTFEKLDTFGYFDLVRITQDKTDLKPPFDIAALRATLQTHYQAMQNTARFTYAMKPTRDFMPLAQKLFSQLPPDRIAQKVIVASLNRMIHILDGHGGLFLSAEDHGRQNDSDVHIIGIGAAIHPVKDGILLFEVYPESGAAKAGLHSGDVITEVDGQAVTGNSLDWARDHLRGNPDTQTHVRLLHHADVVTITRALFTVKEASVRYVSDLGQKIAVLRISSFLGEKLRDTVANQIANLDPDTKGLVVELRGDPGGRVDQVISIAGEFVGNDRPILIERAVEHGKLTGAEKIWRSDRDQLTNLPVVVLIDPQSASASEIFAGALQHYQRGYVMGTRSFGKGSMQQISPFQIVTHRAPLDVLKVMWLQELNDHHTTARFYQPDGTTNQAVGITPDFEVFLHPNPSAAERDFLTESDLVPSALPPLGERWHQPRPNEIANLREQCLGDNRAADFVAHQAYPEAADYPLVMAQELLGCLSNPAAKNVGSPDSHSP